MELSERATFSFWSQEKVRWGDQDGARHINNVAYAAYLETSRLELMLAKVIPHKAKGDNFTVRSVSIEYLGSAAYPNQLEIGSAIVEVGSSSFTIGQGVFLGDRCLATGQTVHVHLRQREPFPLTDELRAALEAELPG